MSAPRLFFLYPHLWRPATGARALSISPTTSAFWRGPRRDFSCNGIRCQDYPQRYGTAHEPAPIELPPPEAEAVQEKTKSLADGIEQEVRTTENKNRSRSKTSSKPKQSSTEQKGAMLAKDIQPETLESLPAPAPQTIAPTASQQPSTSSSLSETLNPEPPPSISADEEEKPPQLSPRRHIHHFDTYTLVSRLTSPSPSPDSPSSSPAFTEPQATTLMKAVRALLTHNLSVAHSALQSKSTMEKQNYTFTAACSEMRTSIGALKRRNAHQASARLAHSRHDVEILSQRLQQETLTLRDEMRAMLDDRRMASRMEDRERESWMQELNTMIAVKLVSGVKSEVEGLRWFLTRSAALTLLGFVVTALMVLRVGSSRKEKDKKDKNDKDHMEREMMKSTVPSREMGTQTQMTEGASASASASGRGSRSSSIGVGTDIIGEEEALYKNVEQGGNPGYVSLG